MKHAQWRKSKHTFVAGILALTVAPGPAAATPEGQIRLLKRELSTVKKSRDGWRGKARHALGQNLELGGQVAALSTTVGTLTNQVATLTAERDSARGERDVARAEAAQVAAENTQLRGELPERVAAIAKADNAQQLQQLVLVPAYNNWACRGSIYYGETFFSFDFDRRTSNGSCY